MTPRLERALRLSAFWHRNQTRKASEIPYIQHPVAVAMILDRLGCAEGVVIAGLLHDVVEDTEATLDDVEREFGERVASIVRDVSEVKTDAQGRKRPWAERKRTHLEALTAAPEESKAVALADKLHNLLSIALDLSASPDAGAFWQRFNAPREESLRNYRVFLETLGSGSPVLEQLGSAGGEALAEVVSLSGGEGADGGSDQGFGA